jgi:hypothetical protein
MDQRNNNTLDNSKLIYLKVMVPMFGQTGDIIPVVGKMVKCKAMAFLLGRMAGVMKGIMPRTSNMDMVV